MRFLYIDIDSLRPDHLGCYGYQRRTSPVIDAIASAGLVLENCHTSDAPCLPSRAALFSGRFGIRNGVTCHNGPARVMRLGDRAHGIDPAEQPWMRTLQLAKWETACFSGFLQRHNAWWFSAGFTQNFANQLPGSIETADDVNAKVVPWLRANGARDNWFCHVNYWDVHHPYRPPAAERGRFAGQALPAYPTAAMLAHDVEHMYGPRRARDWWTTAGCVNPGVPPFHTMPAHNMETMEHFAAFVDLYDAALHFVDDRIGQLLGVLEEIGIGDETTIIVSADHGESVGELGMYFEHGNCAEGTTHVPMVIATPGGKAGRSAGLAYQLDLCPTVLDLAGVAVPAGWDGRSFAGAMAGGAHAGRDHLVLGTGIYSYQRAVRTATHRLIRTYHSGLYPYEPLYLFDMVADPCQRRNLVDAEPATAARLDHLMHEFVCRHTTGPHASADPFAVQMAAGVNPDLYFEYGLMKQRLEALGRRDQLADLNRQRGMV